MGPGEQAGAFALAFLWLQLQAYTVSFYLSSAHLQHARQKHILDFVTQQGVLDGAWRSDHAVFSCMPLNSS